MLGAVYFLYLSNDLTTRLPNGLKFRNNSNKLEWQDNSTGGTWNPFESSVVPAGTTMTVCIYTTDYYKITTTKNITLTNTNTYYYEFKNIQWASFAFMASDYYKNTDSWQILYEVTFDKPVTCIVNLSAILIGSVITYSDNTYSEALYKHIWIANNNKPLNFTLNFDNTDTARKIKSVNFKKDYQAQNIYDHDDGSQEVTVTLSEFTG